MNFGLLKKKGIYVYDLPLINGWHANTNVNPEKNKKIYGYFGYNWWDLMYSGILQKSKYVGIGSYNIIKSIGPGYLLINCSNKKLTIKNTFSGDVYNIFPYKYVYYNPTRENTLVSDDNKCIFNQIKVGDSSYILVGVEDLLTGESNITKTVLFSNLLIGSGIINSELYYNTTGLNAYLSKSYRIGKHIETEEDMLMMDWVNTVEDRWNIINPTRRLPKGDSIPHKIHWIWLSRLNNKTNNIINPLNSKYYKFIKSWIVRNPNCEYYLWTDSIESGLNKELQDKIQIMNMDNIYDVLNKLPKESKDGVINMFENHPNVGSRADTLRQSILYVIGGVYADVNDMACLIPMEKYMDYFDFMAGMEPMMYVNNAFVASAPKHIITKNFLLQISENSDEYIESWDPNMEKEEKDNLVVSQTGPVAFSSILYGIFHKDEDDEDDEYKDNNNIICPRTCIFPSKFIYSNYEIDDSPLSWLSPVTLSGHFDERAYLK